MNLPKDFAKKGHDTALPYVHMPLNKSVIGKDDATVVPEGVQIVGYKSANLLYSSLLQFYNYANIIGILTTRPLEMAMGARCNVKKGKSYQSLSAASDCNQENNAVETDLKIGSLLLSYKKNVSTGAKNITNTRITISKAGNIGIEDHFFDCGKTSACLIGSMPVTKKREAKISPGNLFFNTTFHHCYSVVKT